MDERAQEKLHKESLKGIIDSITLKKREANGLHQVHNPILNAEKRCCLTTGKHDGTEKSLRMSTEETVRRYKIRRVETIQRNGGLDHWIANFRSGY